MGPGDPPVVRVWTAHMGRFRTRPVQKPDPLTLGEPNPNPSVFTHRLSLDSLDPSVPISGCLFRVSHWWSHSDMLLLIAKYWHWYVTVHFRCIGSLNDQHESTHVPYRILKLCVNRASTIVGHVSWVLWRCDRSNTVVNKVLATFIAKKASKTVPNPSWKWASTEGQRFWVLHLP